MYRDLYPPKTELSFLSRVFQGKPCAGQKTGICKLKKIEIMSSSFKTMSVMKYDSIIKKNDRRKTKTSGD